jgi:hypothetical protein
MNQTNLRLLLAAAALLMPSYVYGQTSSRTTFNHNETIKQEYDRFKDVTSVSMTLQLRGDKRDRLALILVHTFSGEKPPKKTDERLRLLFMAAGSTKKYAKWNMLIILANGERFNAGEASYYDDTAPGKDVELIAFVYPFDIFRRIVSAKKVEAQLGETEYTFTEQKLEALRDYFSRLVP